MSMPDRPDLPPTDAYLLARLVAGSARPAGESDLASELARVIYRAVVTHNGTFDLRRHVPAALADRYAAEDVGRVLDQIIAVDPEGPAPVPSAPRYTLHWADEALVPPAEVEWVVGGLLARGSVSVFVGEPGSKKTWTVLDAAVCVSLGRAWLHFPVARGPVLVIDEESGHRRMHRRLHELLRHRQVPDNLPLAWTTLAQFDIRNPTDLGHIRQIVADVQPIWVIVDALADVVPGADENDVKDMQPAFQALRGIAEEFNLHITLLHHTNKMGGYRGSSAIKGAVDLMLMVKSEPKESAIEYESVKSRDTEAIKFSALVAFSDTGVWLGPAQQSEADAAKDDGERYVLHYLKTHGRSFLADIANAADTCPPASARRAVYRLAARGIVARVDAGKATQRAEYDLQGRP